MARDPDHAGVARRTLEEGKRLLAAWDAYTAKTRALAGIRPCTSTHQGLLCQLVDGHTGRHRHRALGLRDGQLPPTVEWP